MADAPEEMKSFFDLRVEGYDEHMASTIEHYNNFYRKIADPIIKTNENISILDLGAGTGIEIEFILAKAPNAVITAVDLSRAMLNKLTEKFKDNESQIKTVAGSYLTLELEPGCYDYIVSVMSLHHLLPAKKTALYEKIVNALVPTGAYIEGDYVVSADEEKSLLDKYTERIEGYSLTDDGRYHIVIPFSEETQKRVLIKAGFAAVEVIFRTPRSNIVVAKPIRWKKMNTKDILPEWAPRVKQRKIRQFYEMDAKGIYDDELIDEVGYSLFSRCKSFIEAVEAFSGKARCPVCDAIVNHSSQKEELLRCTCGWQLTWGKYFGTIQHKQLSGAEPVLRQFRTYVEEFRSVKTNREKVLPIDRLIHGFHWYIKKNLPTRPVAVNLIEGKLRDVIKFLDSLTYSDKSTPGIKTHYDEWDKTIETEIKWIPSRKVKKFQY